MKSDTESVGLLRRALDSPLGIAVKTEDVAALRRQLYLARRKAGREREKFDTLSFVPNPFDDAQLWIIRNFRAPFNKNSAPAV